MNTKELTAKYGEPGTNQVYVQLPYRMRLSWDLDKSISKFQCHKSIAPNLEAIFTKIKIQYGEEKLRELGLDIFGGCLNVRPMREGTRLSIHSWGLAVDLHPTKNQLRWGKDKALFAQPEYDIFWHIVEANGGYSLGRLKNYDWMHFQFVPIGK